MNAIIIILATIGSLVALFFIVGLFLKKEFEVKGEVVIDKPRKEVFDYVKLLKNQDHYNQWVMADPDMKKEFKGTDGTVGFVYGWDGNKKVGTGEQIIKAISEDERIDAELRFIKPFESVCGATMITTFVSESKTRVRWSMTGSVPYPRNIMNPIINRMLTKSLNESLALLKGKLETVPSAELVAVSE